MNIEYQYHIVTMLKANHKMFCQKIAPEEFCLMFKFSNKTNNKASSCGMIGMLHAKMTSTGEKVLAGNEFNKTLEAI